MIYVFHINTDDNENGWFPPGNSSGKIFVNARGWTSYPQESKPTYDQAEHFLRFLGKYVSHAVSNHQKWFYAPYRIVEMFFHLI